MASKLSGDTVVVSFATLDTATFDTIENLEIRWIDMSDPADPHTYRQIDASNHIFRPEHTRNNSPFHAVKDDQLILMQRNSRSSPNFFEFLSLLWYNANGELLSRIERMEYAEGQFYTYVQHVPQGSYSL